MTSMTLKRSFAAVLGAMLMVTLFLVYPQVSSSANKPGPCVPKDAYTEVVVVTPAVPAIPEVPGTPGSPAIPGTPGVPATPAVTEEIKTYQHYSWTGGRRKTSNPPTVVPPHEDWQENTKHEPHKSATWVNDSLHYTANSKGHASWFYLETITTIVVITPEIPAVPGTPDTPAVLAVPGTPAVPAVPAVTEEVFHEAVVCPSPTPQVTPETPSVTPSVTSETPTVTPVETTSTPTEQVTPTPEVETETPEAEVESEDPVVTTTTKSTPNKTVKIHTHESGKKTRTVKRYRGVIKEEGL